MLVYRSKFGERLPPQASRPGRAHATWHALGPGLSFCPIPPFFTSLLEIVTTPVIGWSVQNQWPGNVRCKTGLGTMKRNNGEWKSTSPHVTNLPSNFFSEKGKIVQVSRTFWRVLPVEKDREKRTLAARAATPHPRPFHLSPPSALVPLPPLVYSPSGNPLRRPWTKDFKTRGSVCCGPFEDQSGIG